MDNEKNKKVLLRHDEYEYQFTDFRDLSIHAHVDMSILSDICQEEGTTIESFLNYMKVRKQHDPA